MVGLRLSNAAFLGGMRAVYDANAQAIINAVNVVDGAVLEPVVQNAITALVIGCKADLTWPFLSAGVLRLFAGPRTLAGIQKCGVGTDPTNVGFVIGDYIRSLGLKGDGISKYFNINRNNNIDGQNDRCSAVWVSGSQTDSFGVYIGGGIFGNGTDQLAHNVGTTQILSRCLTIEAGAARAASASVIGFVGHSRANPGFFITRFSGENATVNEASSAPFSGQTNLFARSLDTPSFSNARIGFYYRGPDIGASGMALLDARVATYMSAIAGL